MTAEQVISGRAIELLKSGEKESKVVTMLKKEFNIKKEPAIAAIVQAKVDMNSAKQENEKVIEPVEEKVVHTDTETKSDAEAEQAKQGEVVEEKVETPSEIEIANAWEGEGSDLPCDVYGQQDVTDPACEACKTDCPKSYTYCGIKSSKPKAKKKVVSTSTSTVSGTKRVKGAGYEKVKFIEGLIAEGTHTQKEVLDIAQAEYPAIKEITLRTYITDSKNMKYFAKHGFVHQTKVVEGKLCY